MFKKSKNDVPSPDEMGPQVANGSKPFEPPAIYLMPSLQELTSDRSFEVSTAAVGTPM